MTLLEMIKKYEKVDANLRGKPGAVVIGEVLRDLHSIKDDIDVRAIRFKVLRLINRELDNSNFEDVRNLAQAMHLLSLPD